MVYLLVCKDYQPVLSVPDTQGSQDLEKTTIRTRNLTRAYGGFSLIPATTGVGAPAHLLILPILSRCCHAGHTGDPDNASPRSWLGIYVRYAYVFG